MRREKENKSPFTMELYNENEIYEQFKLDAPRYDVYLNGNLYEFSSSSNNNNTIEENEEVNKLYEMVKQLNNKRAVFMFTQQALCPYYDELRKLLFDDEGKILDENLKKVLVVHLMDGGKQSICLDDCFLKIVKPFKIVSFSSENQYRFIAAFLLLITLNLKTNNLEYSWQKMTYVENDWFVVEDDFFQNDENLFICGNANKVASVIQNKIIQKKQM